MSAPIDAASPPLSARARDAGSRPIGARLRRCFDTLAYGTLNLPLGAIGLVVVAVLLAGAALSVVLVGLPLLLGGEIAARALARGDRRLANALLDAHLGPLPPRPVRHGGALRRAVDTVADRQLWRIVALLTVKPFLAAAILVVGLVPLLVTAALAGLGLEGLFSFGDVEYVGPASLTPGLGMVLLALAVPWAIVAVAVLDGLHAVMRMAVRALLVPRVQPDGPVRELLAESLGDRTASIAYWLPEREVFVDEAGHPVELPEPGSGRAWTAVERDGRRVAAIVHDAALDTGPELVHAAASAAALAIDNERLKAELRARVEELRVSRARIVEASDEARRRLERDLHDGAQQQLVSLALELRVLKARLDESELVGVVDSLNTKVTAALADLRELARGIHPAILTDRGLAPAVAALAARCPVPVRVDVRIAERLPAPVEAAAYFVVAEALTNVAKYAEAGAGTVTIDRDAEELRVSVQDDGRGGADPGAGSGLRGLHDRIAALDGSLEIDSPVGGGTRVDARVPIPGANGRPG